MLKQTNAMLKNIFLLSLLFILISCHEKKQPSPSPISLQDSISTQGIDSNVREKNLPIVNNQIQDSLIFQLDIQPTEGDPSPWMDASFENYNRDFFIPLKNRLNSRGLGSRKKDIELVSFGHENNNF